MADMKKKYVKELLWLINDPAQADPREKLFYSQWNWFKHQVDKAVE